MLLRACVLGAGAWFECFETGTCFSREKREKRADEKKGELIGAGAGAIVGSV